MFEEDIAKIYNKIKPIKSGKNADYIPELSKVNPNLGSSMFRAKRRRY